MKKNALRIDLILTILLALLPLLFFWRVITPIPSDQRYIAGGDFTEQYFPLRAFTARAWAQGEVPLWNPSLFGGQPGLADIQSGALYPPHVLQAVILGAMGVGFPLSALEWQMILHFSVAGVGGFWLGRYWAKRHGASLVSARLMGVVLAISFGFGGYLTSFPVQQVSILQVSAWLPWVLLTLTRAIDGGLAGLSWRKLGGRVGLAGLAMAMAILAGHPQTVMYVSYLSLAWAGFVGISPHPSRPHPNPLPEGEGTLPPSPSGRGAGGEGLPGLLKTLLIWAAMMALAVSISAAQLWPTLRFIGRSLRDSLSFEAVAAGLPLSELVTLLYPGFLGGSPGYVGIFTLILIAAALSLSRSGTALRAEIWFWVGVAAVSLLLVFGAATFAYPLAYLFLPGFESVRQQERIFLLFGFSAATLAGYGAMLISQPFSGSPNSGSQKMKWQTFWRRLKVVSGVALGLTGVFLFGAMWVSSTGAEVNLFNGVLRHHLLGLLVLGGGLILLALRPRRLWRRYWGLALVAGWLIFNLFSVNWQFNLEDRAQRTPFVPQGASLFLLEHLPALGQPARISSGGQLPGGNNAGLVFGLEDVTGNTPLQLAEVAEFSAEMPSWRFWQLFNVRYVVDERDLDGPGLARRYEGADGLKVYEVGDPFERAWLVYAVVRGDDFGVLAEDAFDLKRTALIDSTAWPNLSLSEADSAGAVWVEAWGAGHLSLRVQSESPGLVVISEVYDPGWQATLNGERVSLGRVNGVLQGVVVPAGESRLELRYAPLGWVWGRWVSLAGVLVSLGLVGSGAVGRRGLTDFLNHLRYI